MSKALSAPRAARTPATVAGRSWMEAVFNTTRVHSSLLAVPPQPSAIRLAARMPRGVAALPKPSRLADTLPDSAARVSGSWHARGRRRPSRGRNRRLRPSMSPLAFMMDITPLHRHRTPAIRRHSSTAAAAPSRAAFPTAPTVPFIRPKTTDAVTISVHTQAIAIPIPPVFGSSFSTSHPISTGEWGKVCQKIRGSPL